MAIKQLDAAAKIIGQNVVVTKAISPYTLKVWGDPHVSEKGGTVWDQSIPEGTHAKIVRVALGWITLESARGTRFKIHRDRFHRYLEYLDW